MNPAAEKKDAKMVKLSRFLGKQGEIRRSHSGKRSMTRRVLHAARFFAAQGTKFALHLFDLSFGEINVSESGNYIIRARRSA
jgi:hypothetical protein